MDDRFLSNGTDKRFKFIIIGDSGVGKTALFWKYIEGEFLAPGETSVTVTVDFKMKIVKYKGESIRLNIWDTAGQEKYRSIVSTYFKSCNGMLLVFDQSRPQTFENIVNQWYPMCMAKTEGVKMVLVGNKIDLERAVRQQDIQKWCQPLGIKYFGSSAKDNKNVQEPFMELIDLVMNQLNKSNKTSTKENGFQKNKTKSLSSIKHHNAKSSSKSNCCK